jgi:hypothetical protein
MTKSIAARYTFMACKNIITNFTKIMTTSDEI